MSWAEPFTFLRQTVSAFHTTGAVAPSSSFLARAMVRSLPAGAQIPDNLHVLEVGAGTGSLTAAIAARMNGRGRLLVYEINPTFVAHLQSRIAREPGFGPMRGRLTVQLGNVLELEAPPAFDVIISGLPFNNFTPEEVRRFLEHFRGLLLPGGTLTFFEYFGIRRLQQPFVSRARRTRLKAIAEVVETFARSCQYGQQLVWLNLPPARARHMRMRS